MRKRTKRREDAAEVNMTPMLDIVFILLIFFIVTATFLNEEGIDGNEEPYCEEDKANFWESEIRRWKPLFSLWDAVYFIEASPSRNREERVPPHGEESCPSFKEWEETTLPRLVERSLKTWNEDKTKLWGGGTPREAATRRVRSNDARNARVVYWSKPYATRYVSNRADESTMA